MSTCDQTSYLLRVALLLWDLWQGCPEDAEDFSISGSFFKPNSESTVPVLRRCSQWVCTPQKAIYSGFCRSSEPATFVKASFSRNCQSSQGGREGTWTELLCHTFGHWVCGF